MRTLSPRRHSPRALLTGALLFGTAAVCSAAPAAAADADGGTFDVRAFGAAGDGKALDTPAIDKAIAAAAAAGGGTVRFPAGTYRSVSVHLKSNVALYLGPGATLLAADVADGAAYDAPEPNPAGGSYQDFGHGHWHNALLWGENLENVSILGPGRIYGKGLVRSDKGEGGKGDKSISLKNCRNVVIRDVTLQHGGWFAILATGVDNLTIDDLKIDTNRDGMDIDCCRNVRVSNCSVNSPFDDGICLKSSYGLGVARATENVTIANCQVSGYDEGTFLDGTFQRGKTAGAPRSPTGRIKFGTESNGGFKNVTITNCVFDYCRGLALETVDGGLLEDVTISNLTMRDVVNSPLFLRLGSRMRAPQGTPVGALRRVILSNIVVYNADPRYACILSGIPDHPLQDVTLSDVRIYTRGGGTREQASAAAPENEKGYPEPSMFGATPAYGFFVRHAQGLRMTGVSVTSLSPDLRPAFVLNDVHDADFRQVAARKAPDTPAFVLSDVTDFRLRDSPGLADADRAKVSAEKF